MKSIFQIKKSKTRNLKWRTGQELGGTMAENFMSDRIRNFCIIAHIDAGKSTLADRFLEITGAVEKGKHTAQFLDQMDLEQERGITIKLQPVRLQFDKSQISPIATAKGQANLKSTHRQSPERRSQNDLKIPNSGLILNLVDTPGHVDFSYEVSRTLAVVEGAILLVDATQGVQAQTLSTLKKAMAQNLAIIPVINKIDLPSAQIKRCEQEIKEILPAKFCNKIYHISSKIGKGVDELLSAVVQKIPSPNSHTSEVWEFGEGQKTNLFQALIFDSHYDQHRGVVAHIRVFSGSLKAGEDISFLSTGKIDKALEVGFFMPRMTKTSTLNAGDIGYAVTNLRAVGEAQVGDTIILKKDLGAQIEPLSGYKKPQSVVFASIFPLSNASYPLLQKALEKLALNDSSFNFSPDHSPVLGAGFEIGLLGLLHLEILLERLRREFQLDLIATFPSPEIQIELKNGVKQSVKGAWQMPDASEINAIKEPFVLVTILTTSEFVGAVMNLTQNFRGELKNSKYLSEKRVELHYEMPISEILRGFYDRLKSVSSGFASMSYQWLEFRQSNLKRLDTYVAGDLVLPLSILVPEKDVYARAKNLAERLKEFLPRQVFEVKIQVMHGGKVIASERISPLRKDVTGHLYGGDVTRKNKLLQKQKKGKKRLQKFGRVDIPTDVFVKLLK